MHPLSIDGAGEDRNDVGSMDAVVLSIVAAILVGANKVFFRQAALRNVSSEHLLVIFYFGGVACSVLYYPLPAVFDREPLELSLLVANGLIWTLISAMDTRVYKSIEASVVALLDSIQLLLLTAVGLILFGESLPLLKLLGVLCVAGAVGFSTRSRPQGDAKVIAVKLLSVCLAGAALSIDKFLASRMPIGDLVVLGYAIPGLFLVLYTRPNMRGLAASAFKLGRYTFVLSVCSFGGFACTIHAFATGSLTVTSALIQTSIVVTLLVEFVVGDVRGARLRPALCAGACTVGAIAVVL